MAVEVFANLPTTTVTSGGTDAPASGTTQTWTVASSAIFPAVSSTATPPTQLHVADVALNSEMIAVTNISGTTWTVTRGAEGTTPVSHGAGFTIYQVATAGALAQLRAVDWLNVVTVFGAKGDGISNTDGAITSGLAVLTSASASFTSADVGKLVAVAGAGAAGAVLATTISGFTDTHTVTLAATAATTVTGAAEYTYGTANDTAFANAIAALPQPSQGVDFPGVTGGGIYIPAGRYCLASALNWKINGLKVITDGQNATILQLIGTNQPVVELARREQDISGITFTYSQIEPAANTASMVAQLGDDTIGNCFESNYHELVFQFGQTGMGINPAIVNIAGLFSSRFANIQVNGYSASAFNLNANNSHGNANATGCVFENIYSENEVAGGAVQTSASPFIFKNFDESVINQLNIEHSNVTSGDVLLISVCNNLVFNSLHFEGLTLGVNGQALIHQSTTGNVIINGMMVFGCTFSGSGSNPVVNFFGTGTTNLRITGYCEKTGTITTPSHPFINWGSATNCTAVIDGISLNQTTANATAANSGDVALFGIPVTSVAAADTSVVVGGTTQAPTVRTNTLDVVAAQHPAAADWSNNSHKITNLLNGAAAQDAAAFGQIPVIDATAGDIQALGAAAAAGSTGKAADAGHVHTAVNGITPVTSGWTIWSTGQGVDLLNNTSVTSASMVAGTIYYTSCYIGSNCTLTGILAGVGTTAGTDSWIAVLYNSAGGVVANSALAGIAVSATISSKQKFAFTGTVNVTGPGLYFIGLQSNGTTAKYQAYPNLLEAFAAVSKPGNSFGTLTLGAPALTYTQSLGPVACTY